MKRFAPILALILFASAAGCSRNGEYRYLSELQLLENRETLLPKIRQRLITSEFRKNYDQTLVDRIGSSFKNFKHIRAYQKVLEDALVYIMIETGARALPDGIRGEVIRPVSRLILSDRTGEQMVDGLNRIAAIMKENSGDALPKALADYDSQLRLEH